MNRIFALAFPFLVLVGAVVTFAWFEAQRVPDWEIELNNYIAQSQSPHEIIKIEVVDEANQPGNFRPTMGMPVRNDWPWDIEELPYPPTAVQCVLLEKRGNSAFDGEGEQKRQVIYVAYHSDALWRAGWLVHESPRAPNTPELIIDLATIGCELGLE